MSGETDLFEGPAGDDERAPSSAPARPAPSSTFFELVGEAEEEMRKGRGRPPGARNRKSESFEKWYFAAGYKDPAVVLAEIASADPRALARAASIRTAEALELQRKCAVDLLPYLHGKKPISVEVEGQLLPILAILTGDDQLAQAARLEQANQLSIGRPIVEGEAKEINGLEEGK